MSSKINRIENNFNSINDDLIHIKNYIELIDHEIDFIKMLIVSLFIFIIIMVCLIIIETNKIIYSYEKKN